MQTLEFANKIPTKSNNDSKVVSKSEELEYENKREGKGKSLAISRNVYRLLNSRDVCYVQSEHSSERYYFVKYNPDVFEWCSCPDNSIRHVKCKHQFAIEYAIKLGTLKDIEKLPENAQKYPQKITAKDWRDDDYDF